MMPLSNSVSRCTPGIFNLRDEKVYCGGWFSARARRGRFGVRVRESTLARGRVATDNRPWYAGWVSGQDVFDVPREQCPIEMRWLVYQKPA